VKRRIGDDKVNESIELQGQTCLVTGASSGIGKATTFGLAKRGAAVVMVCRDEERGQAAQAEIVTRSGNKSVDLFTADLATQSAVRQVADAFKAKYSKLHVLINNAGLNLSRRTITADGNETIFAVNYLAPFLLTHLLLDRLQSSAPARVINLATWMHPPVDLDDLRREKHYDPMEVYLQSKTAVVLFTEELARGLPDGVTINCVNPGMIRTNLGRDLRLRGSMRVFLAIMRPFMKRAEQAGEVIVYLATAPELASISGKYFVGKREGQAFQKPYDPKAAQRLWQVSERLTQLYPFQG
jgi:NAD(P)-dependent dehydrogenase (short-subunit alcohol dehydrogenase family)